MQTSRIRCPQCEQSLEVGVPPADSRTRRVVTRCAGCDHDLVVSRGRKAEEPLRIRACKRWAVTCPYCKEPTIARVPPAGMLRRKETTPCAHCRKPLIVERREEGKVVLRAHRGILEGALL